jgi:murein DD-endopeptidase MepM/ murein hydrolase activator NlpD
LIFRKKKYHYNPVTLTFDEIKSGGKQHIKEIFFYTFISLSLTILSGYLLNQLLGSQEARVLENKVISLNQKMQLQFDLGRNLGSSLQNNLFIKDNNYRTILQMDTLPFSYRMAGTGGSAAENKLVRYNDLSYKVDNMIDKLKLQLQIHSGSLEIVYEKALEHSAQQTHIPAIQPVSQKDLLMISSNFGVRFDPFYFVEQIHNGLDFVAPVGRNVYATGDGIVTFIQYSRKGYGNEIVIDHKFGFGSRYAHLDTIKVKEGENVNRGQIIGTVGETGRATGPHLHYEVLFEHKPLNPLFYFDSSLTNEEYAQIINKANKDTN